MYQLNTEKPFGPVHWSTMMGSVSMPIEGTPVSIIVRPPVGEESDVWVNRAHEHLKMGERPTMAQLKAALPDLVSAKIDSLVPSNVFGSVEVWGTAGGLRYTLLTQAEGNEPRSTVEQNLMHLAAQIKSELSKP